MPAEKRRSHRLAVVAAGGAVVLAIAASVGAAAFDRGGTGSVDSAIASSVVVGACAIVGLVLVVAGAAERLGVVLVSAAVLWGVGDGLTEAGVHGIVTVPGSVPGAAGLAAIGPALRGSGWFLAASVVLMVFPDGRLPPGRWRLWRLGASVAVLGQFAGSVLDPHAQESRLAAWHSPLGLPEHAQWAAGAISAVSVLCGAFAIIASVYGLVRRWRTGNDVVRQRVVLLVLGVVPPLAVIAVVVGATTVPGWLFAVALVPLPTVVGVAVLKDGIYGLRRATSRTMLWLIMSAVIAAVYALVLVLAAATQTGRHAWWPSAVAAAAVGFVMIPARDRVQRLVNRAVYGRVQEPYEVLADLGARLEGASDPGHAIETVLAEVATELGLREVAVFDTEGTFIAGSQAPSGEARSSIDLFAFGRPVGALRYRADGANLAGAEHRLLGDLSRQLGSAVDARIVRDDLDRVRERLSYAREEERRRLRRDLHDGIGAAIAGLTLKAETTRRVLPHDPAQGAATLNELCSGIRDLMAEVRRVVDGLRPPALDELGLGAAVRQAVEPLAFEAGIALDVVAEELTALPAATEIAVYRIAVEAVTNVVRHARASRCCVEIHTDPTSVTLTVRDDGRGLGRPSGGHGLATMRERAMELGGVLTLADHDGVTVRTCIPVAHPPGGGA